MDNGNGSDDKPKGMDRRTFVTAAGLAGAAGLVAACAREENHGQACTESNGSDGKSFEWKMATTWPRDFPGLGSGANTLADYIGRMSSGRLTVKVFGANELLPPLEVFSGVQQGTVQMGHGASYYWKGQVPSSQIFCGVPFGLTGHELNGWYYYGGGLEIYQQAYESHGVVPFPAGNTGTQMGGWFNKEINSVSDLVGLKMRIPGLGGEVLRRAGGTPVMVAGGELFTSLESGNLDAAEWVGPYNDLASGLFRAAKYYYYPGWQEPGTGMEALINAAAWAQLPADLQDIVALACQAANADMYAEFEARNGTALHTLVHEHHVQLRAFPGEVLADLKHHTEEALNALIQEDEWTARAYASMKAYMDQVRPWTKISEQYYLNHR